MTHLNWGSPSSLRALLNELVSWESVTLTEGERIFPHKLKQKLKGLAYFVKHPHLVELHDADLGRKFLTALYKHPQAKKTICLISHFDTVSTEDYGDLQKFATDPEQLTEALKQRQGELPYQVWNDLNSGDYLFGRGTMDMKMGLALHMQLLEKASVEKWPINLVLVTVPDEEVNSAGMRHAAVKLLELKKEYHLEYLLFLNSEPVFSQVPDDARHYIYSGTIGKMLPAALFYGKETHAGEPLSGMSSPYIASYLTRKMEWNRSLQEMSFGEKTPVPVTLMQGDLSEAYSTKIPFRSFALYNVFMMEKSAASLFDRFEQIANSAAAELNEDYKHACKLHQVDPIGEVTVIRYEKLLAYAERKLGKELINNVKVDVQSHQEWDEREKSLRIVDELMLRCQELAPAIVIMLAPPYYPAVNSSNHELVERCVDFVKRTAKDKFSLTMERLHYFNGLCDLSYVSYTGSEEEQSIFEKNAPVWNDSYSLPFKEMKQLDAPVLNVGPFGKDAHKRTERLHIKNAFEEMPALLEELIQMLVKT